METGNNDLDLMDDIDDFSPEEVEENLEDQGEYSQNIDPDEEQVGQEDYSEDNFIDSLLRSRGIEDSSKIKFENDEGEIEEVDWNTLSNQDKLNILNSSEESPEDGLDDSEIQLINAIRQSGMSPTEYLQQIQSDSVNSYIQTNYTPQYSVDQYSDDELFLADFISRMGDVTDEEAREALENAKANETLFAKQIEAIRNEYKTIEDENYQQEQAEQEQQALEQYNQFAQSVVDEINNFTEFSGYDLNLDQDEMQELYEFITGHDGAGNNYFAKALADPQILVQTAWFALNGKQMIDDITEYFQKEITHVRKESYNKGLADASKDKSNIVYKQSNKTRQEFSDLDDF